MGQNNDTTERGDLQGHQGGQKDLPASERERESSYGKPNSDKTVVTGPDHTKPTGE